MREALEALTRPVRLLAAGGTISMHGARAVPKLEAKDLYVEQYVTDLLKTPEDNLVIEVLVPIK